MELQDQSSNFNPSSTPVNISNFKKMSTNTIKNIVLIVTAVIFALVYIPKKIVNPGTITVTGVGKIAIIPRSASVIITRVNLGEDPTTAITNGGVEINVLINEAKKIVGQDAEIQKSFYTATQTTSGKFQVTNGFKVTFNNISKVNDLIKSMYNNGASTVSNISFMPEDKDKTAQDVKKLAIDDAKKQAENTVKELRKKVGRIISITDDSSEIGGSVASGNGEVGATDINITKTVTIVYEIW
jgi:uncharacterized protein YggE